MKFLLGTKEYMTQLFDEQGNAHPVTVVALGQTVVTQVKSKEKDGYTSIQIGFGARTEKHTPKAQAGHLKKAKEKTADLTHPQHFREFAVSEKEVGNFEVGSLIALDTLVPGDKVQIIAISKSKGFQGVVKRHGFHGGPRTHGQKHSERAPGSIGAAGVQRVFKGKRMAGRMGGDRITLKNLKVLKVDVEAKELYLRGAVPGRKGTLLQISA